MKKKVTNPVVWSPSDERVESSQMYKFIKIINEKHNVNILEDAAESLGSTLNKKQAGTFKLSLLFFTTNN